MRETVQTMLCAECGAVIDYESYTNGDGETVCQDCAEGLPRCDRCDCVLTSGNTVEIDGGREHVCQDCAEYYYYQCDDCGEYVSTRRLWLDRNLTICNDCQWEYCTCYDCDDILRCDDIHNINGYGYCDDCEPSHRNPIRDYNYKPLPEFYGELSDIVKGYYGLELEIDDGEYREEAARCIQDAGGDCIYLKHDGSLSSDGFEIVTHPATLEYHMNTMPWHDIIKVARDYDYTSHDAGTCGLHIHASRSLFGADRTTQDLNIAKIILLIDFWWEQYIVPFSRRNYNQLNDWAKKPNAYIMASDSEYDAICKAKQSGECDRYKAVNLKNRHTVEFRFFRGTLRRDTIIASIQFVDTLINYVSSVELADLWDKTFNDVFGDTQYAELKDYLQKRKLLDESEEV